MLDIKHLQLSAFILLAFSLTRNSICENEIFKKHQKTGRSSILYSGIIPLADNLEDTAFVLIRLLPELLETHDICNNPESISKVNIALTSITSLVADDSSFLIHKDSLNIYFLQVPMRPVAYWQGGLHQIPSGRKS